MADAIVRTKRCSHCRIAKPVSDFWKNKSSKDGLQSNCIPCQREANAKSAHTDHGRALARVRVLRHQKTAKGRATWERSHREQRDKGYCKARDAVSYAVRTGKMPKASSLTCHVCDKPARYYHHHLGCEREHYLHVLPVCAVCHKNLETPATVVPYEKS